MSFIQSNSTFNTANANSWTCAFSSSVTSGNLIVIAIAGQAYSTPQAFSVSDSLSTTFSQAITHTATVGGNSFVSVIFYGTASSSGSNTISVTYPSGGGTASAYTRVLIHEYSNLTSLDQTSYATGTSATLTTGSMSTTHANELIFGWMVSNAGVSSAGTGFTQRESAGSEISEDMAVTSTGSYSATATGASSDDYLCLGATFYDSGSSGGGGGGGTGTGSIVTDTPENHGAKRDGRLVTGTYTSSSSTFELDSSVPTALQFTSADVGKVFVLRNPSPGATTVTTVSSVTDSTHCVLTSGPGSNYATTFAVLGTDDTAAINSAVSNVVTTAQGQGISGGKVLLSQGIYMVSAATTKTTTNLGNAQIPLPLVAPQLNSKFVLEISGPIDCSAPPHWAQNVPNNGGAILLSTLLSQSSDSTYGNPSVIGGPTPQGFSNIGYPTGWSSSNNVYSDMHLILKNFQLVTPVNTTYGGIDIRNIAQTSIDGLSCIPFDTAGNFGSYGAANINSGQVAVYMPALNNNDLCEIGSLTVYGWSYGLGASDHVNIQSGRFIFCNSAILMVGPNGSDYYYHGWHADYLSIEGCYRGIDATVFKSQSDNAVNFPTTIDHLDSEVIGDYDIDDPNDFLTGSVWIGNLNTTGGVPLVHGAGNLAIYSFFKLRGPATAPSIPSSTTALANPFWRDAAVTVTGTQVTDIAVAGTSLGVASGTVIVPSNKSITLTYSGSGSSPAWNWILL